MAILLFVNQCSMIVISLIFVQKSEHAHSTAPPLQTRPTALGSGLGLTVHEMACASFSATKGRWTLHEHLLFQRRLCRQGVAVMSNVKEAIASAIASFSTPQNTKNKLYVFLLDF